MIPGPYAKGWVGIEGWVRALNPGMFPFPWIFLADTAFITTFRRKNLLPMKRQIPYRLLAILVSVLLASRGGALPHTAPIAAEEAAAISFLRGETRRTDFDLRLTLDLPDVKAYSDARARMFVIVAAKQYHPYLDSPVLAYSTGSAIRQSELTGGTMLEYYFGEYSKALRAIRKSRRTYVPSFLFSTEVEPIVGIHIGQYAPYNETFPDHGAQKTIAGCGAVALAQVLLHDDIGRQPSGEGSYSVAGGAVHTEDLSRDKVDWADMSVRDTSLLLYKAALSVRSDLGVESSSSSLAHFRSALVDNWGYSPRCRFVQGRPLGEVLSLIESDLSGGRPVLVGGRNHIFMCDGMKGDFLHYNFGWTGNFDGWFRLLPSSTVGDSPVLPFSEVLVCIYPDSPQEALSVTLPCPGALDSLLGGERRLSITSLKVDGPINGDDVKVIRRMAGGVDYGKESLPTGALTELDLGGAVFVGEGEFCSFGADGMRVWGTRTRGGETYKFDFVFGEITLAQWEEFCRNRGNVSSTRRYYRDDDGHYSVAYLMQENQVADYMFIRCPALKKVILPATLSKVSDRAFDPGVEVERR